MPFLSRLVAVAAILGLVTNCNNTSILDAYTSTTPQLNGHVYLIRGLIGEIFSRGLDDLSEKINRRGLAASVHGLLEIDSLTEEIIKRYKADPSSAPIILIGHSSGGDAIISMAERMKVANVPVDLAFGFDPTPVAGRVPNNVELFINLFQKSNPIGGGIIKSGAEFRGRLINVDLREHDEIIHITLDKSSKIHDLVVQEIIELVTYKRMKQSSVSAVLPSQQIKHERSTIPTSLPNFISPFFLMYLVPRNEPIELWDSGLQIVVRPGENLQAIAENYRIPVWAIAQINKIDSNAPVEPGRALIVPQHMYRTDSAAIDVSPISRR
jgi:hypothetical protein